jgi:NAD+ synthase
MMSAVSSEFNGFKIAEFISAWLNAYADTANIDSFVVGVSGGIDSAVTATLCLMTGRPVYVVDMPIHQASSEVERSRELCKSLKSRFNNFEMITVPLTEVYEATKSALPQIEDVSGGLTFANTRARLRMTTLYALASQRRALVVGTGNKIEDYGVGFFTKYGDGGVDISPIADLVKSEVYKVGEAIGVPRSIIEAAPTDGLWGDDRTDEDQIGASYPELEIAMQFFEDQGDPSTLSGRALDVYEIYTILNKANQHKILPIPVCIIPR